MPDNTASDIDGKQEPGKKTSSSNSLWMRIGLFVLCLICSLAVFLLGANYYKLFPTNGNRLYAELLSAVFLVAAILCKRSLRFQPYWQISYAFFIAAFVNLVSILFSGYAGAILRFFGTTDATNQGLAIAKVYDTLLVVIPILVLTWLSGVRLDALYLKKGNIHWKWGVGIGALVLINYLTSVLIFYGTGYSLAALGGAVLWGTVFSFSNALLEELWVRGLFLKKLVPLTGTTGAILLTSILFASLHFLAVAYLPAALIPVFVINTFTLGLACGILILKTDSLWGAVLVHAAADLFLFIAMLAVH